MEGKIEKQVKEIINNKINLDKDKLLELEKYSKMFDDLVAKGWAKHRGYTLRSPNDPISETERSILLGERNNNPFGFHKK